MNVMSSYAGAATTVALSASGDLQPYYMGLAVPYPLIVLGVTATVLGGSYVIFKLMEHFL